MGSRGERREEIGPAAEGVGQGDEVLQVLKALRIILVMDARADRLVVLHDGFDLRDERHVGRAHRPQHLEKPLERFDVARRIRPVFERERIAGGRGDPFDQIVRRARADALKQLKDAVPGSGVLRVFDHLQMRQHILDVRRLAELQPAVFDERDVAPVEFDFEIVRVEAATEEHGGAVQRHALLAQLQDHLRHEPALEARVRRRHECGQVARGFCLGEEPLFILPMRPLQDVVGEVEDRLRRAVVVL